MMPESGRRKADPHLDGTGPPGVHPNSWYAQSAHPIRDRPGLAGVNRADICIVGAGYTGLSAALHLAERGYAVRVLEAHRIGWGASGRNGGQVGAGLRLPQNRMEELVGPELARAAWDIGFGAADLVRDLIARHQMDCGYKPGVIEANHRRRFDRRAQAHVDMMHAEYGAHALRYLPPQELREALGTRAYSGGILDMASGHLHPLNYARGLARAALDAGANIHELAPVERIEPGAPARVLTADGEVIADYVILACNGYIGSLEPESAARVLPVNSYIIATEPLPEHIATETIRDDVAVFDSRFVVHYFRLSEDRRMLFGGRESYGDRLLPDARESVRKRMLAIYPYLEPYEITHCWGGTLGITRTRTPNFLRIGPNLLSLGGYSGSGVALATMAGKIAAEAVAGQAERFDIMAGLPTHPFPGGNMFRKPLMALGMIWYALRDRF